MMWALSHTLKSKPPLFRPRGQFVNKLLPLVVTTVQHSEFNENATIRCLTISKYSAKHLGFPRAVFDLTEQLFLLGFFGQVKAVMWEIDDGTDLS